MSTTTASGLTASSTSGAITASTMNITASAPPSVGSLL
jgi:hypothetical protein